MSKLSQFLRNGRDPDWWFDTAIPWIKNRTPPQIIESYGDLYWWLSGADRKSITDLDWDTVIILDACRYDTFEKINELPGQTDVRYSLTPRTPTFLDQTFGDGTYHDIVYVTANPHVHNHQHRFHAVYNVWDTHWDEDLKSVRPESVAEVTRKALEAHPNKRIIAHFMQPHTPFIGEWATAEIGIYSGYEHTKAILNDGTETQWETDPYALASAGEVDIADLVRAYEENLQIALEVISPLVEDIHGKTVVTADHGELLGDVAWPFPWREYGHPDLRSKKALEVPWHVLPYKSRRLITSDRPKVLTSEREFDAIEEKLGDLGYR